MKKIGILALQGDFQKHGDMVLQCGAEPIYIRSLTELESVFGLIIPGGESTTIGKLLDIYNMTDTLRSKIINGLPVYGTCAGLILLAKNIENSAQNSLGLLDITVKRNGYGTQIDSFEVGLDIPDVSKNPVQVVFIRAPVIVKVNSDIHIMATYSSSPVLIRRQNILAGSFHPEITGTNKIHDYFIRTLCTQSLKNNEKSVFQYLD